MINNGPVMSLQAVDHPENIFATDTVACALDGVVGEAGVFRQLLAPVPEQQSVEALMKVTLLRRFKIKVTVGTPGQQQVGLVVAKLQCAAARQQQRGEEPAAAPIACKASHLQTVEVRRHAPPHGGVWQASATGLQVVA